MVEKPRCKSCGGLLRWIDADAMDEKDRCCRCGAGEADWDAAAE